MIGEQHGAVDEHLSTTSTNQIDVSLAATDLELLQVFEFTIFGKYHGSCLP